mgnify:CR=1 FL=1
MQLACHGSARTISFHSKAVAWLELSDRKERGEPVDANNVHRHADDVLRLSRLLAAATRTPLQGKIADDMRRFLKAAVSDGTLDPEAVGFGPIGRAEVLARVAQAYALDGAGAS